MDKVMELKKACRNLEENFSDSRMLYLLSLISQVDMNNYKKAAATFRKFTVKLAKEMKAFRKLTLAVAHEMPKRYRSQVKKVAEA